MKPPQIIAEVGCNHRGSIYDALKHIHVLSDYCRCNFTGAQYAAPIIKFQKRDIASMPERIRNAPHPVPSNSYGATYGEHREALEFSIEDHAALLAECHAQGIGYAVSVWDTVSAVEVLGLRHVIEYELVAPTHIKIPSACNLDFELLGCIASSWEREIHVSLGMTSEREIEKIVSYLERMGVSKRTVLYACTSGYPVPAEHVYLDEVRRLRERYAHRVQSIAFSGHHNGIAIDMAAVAMGCSHIERHFTLDRSWKGTDHAASLGPDGMRHLIRDVASIGEALKSKPVEMCDIEKATRAKLKTKPTDAVIPQKIKDWEKSERAALESELRGYIPEGKGL